MTWVSLGHWLGAIWSDMPARIALSATAVYGVVVVGMVRYAGQHYTRVPGSSWTTSPKAPGAVARSEIDSEQLQSGDLAERREVG